MSASRASRRLLASTLRASQQRSIPTPVIIRTAIRSIASYVPRHQANAISILPTTVDPSSPEFQENAQQMGEVIARLETLTKKVRQGGPPKAREKHIARKKMLPRDRVTALIDPGTSFLELSPLAGEGLYEED